MQIVGIDPGLASTGWAVLNQEDKNEDKIKFIDGGCIQTKSGLEIGRRLEIIHDEIIKVIEKYQPKEMAIEEIFFAKNVKSAIKVAQAVGVIRYSGIQAGLEVYGYTPLNIKTAITGYGQADKNQVQFMVRKIIKTKEKLKSDHQVDAAAAALTHLFTNQSLTSNF